MFGKIVSFIANKYVKEMLFAFIIVVIATEYINFLLVRGLLFIIAFAIAIKPIVKMEDDVKK